MRTAGLAIAGPLCCPEGNAGGMKLLDLTNNTDIAILRT